MTELHLNQIFSILGNVSSMKGIFVNKGIKNVGHLLFE